MRKMLTGIALLLLTAGQAQADYQCKVNPQDDVVITPAQVQVVGASGNVLISPTGEIQRNGKAVIADSTTQKMAVDYQNALRRDLPWIDSGAQQRLEQARAAVDKVVVDKLGAESHVRQRLTTLDEQLKQQMNRIIEHRSDGLAFHHQAIAEVRQDGKKLVQNAMGGMLQDSLNDIGNNSNNPLQALMGNLGGLQQAMKTELRKQEQDFRKFGNDVCQRVTHLESQRQALVARFP